MQRVIWKLACYSDEIAILQEEAVRCNLLMLEQITLKIVDWFYKRQQRVIVVLDDTEECEEVKI